jgi:hypothetical protein
MDPVAEIDTPAVGQILDDVTLVEGSASCKRFDHWSLDYFDFYKDEWLPIAVGYRTVNKGFLAEWNTDDLEQGYYELKLSVFSKKKLEEESSVIVDMTYVPCGDLNGDFEVDPEDIDYFSRWLWNLGPPPFQMRAADVDASCQVDVLDLDYLIDYLINGGPEPMCVRCGDADRDCDVDWDDVYYIAEWLWEGGPEPWPLKSIDCDGSGQFDVLDANYLICHLEENPECPLVCFWLCGDVDASGELDQADLDYFAAWLWEGGPPPMPMESADVDCSGQVDVNDLNYLTDHINNGTPLPCDCVTGS